MLGIDSGWPEKFVRFFCPIAELGNLENGESTLRNSKFKNREPKLVAPGLAMAAFRETKPIEANGLNAIIVKEIS